MIPLPALEEITDRSGIAPRIELLLPIGVRARQLLVRTMLLGMLIVLADHRPAHLTRVHQALTTLPEDDQRRWRPATSVDSDHTRITGHRRNPDGDEVPEVRRRL